MGDKNERYVPSWCRDGDGRKQRTRFKVVEDVQSDQKLLQGEDHRDAEFLMQLPQRIVSPAFSLER